MNLPKLLNYLICPYCYEEGLVYKNETLCCCRCNNEYQVVEGVPVLLVNEKLNKQENNQKVWFEKHYAKFSKEEYRLEDWRLSMLERIFGCVFGSKIKTYLDIGCGATGYTVIEAAKRNNWFSFGVDISVEAMIRAKRLSDKQKVGDKTAFIVCSAENLPFKQEIFDFVSAISLLEHLEYDDRVVGSVLKILKKKGLFYVCVPNTYRKMWPFLWPIYWYFDKQIGHMRHYSIEALDKKLKAYDFSREKYFYNAHLMKLAAIIFKKFNLISRETWWKIERRDFNQFPTGIQLNALYRKK